MGVSWFSFPIFDKSSSGGHNSMLAPSLQCWKMRSCISSPILPQLAFRLLSSVQFSRSVVSDSLRARGLQHARPPCPSAAPRVWLLMGLLLQVFGFWTWAGGGVNDGGRCSREMLSCLPDSPCLCRPWPCVCSWLVCFWGVSQSPSPGKEMIFLSLGPHCPADWEDVPSHPFRCTLPIWSDSWTFQGNDITGPLALDGHQHLRPGCKRVDQLSCSLLWASLVVQLVKSPSAMQDSPVWRLGQENLLEEGIRYALQFSWPFLVTQMVENLPAMRETWVQSLGWDDPLGKGKSTHSSILAWRIPRTVSYTGLQRG